MILKRDGRYGVCNEPDKKRKETVRHSSKLVSISLALFILQGGCSSSFIPSTDGMECEMPSVHCVTRDHGACPQFSPLPPDYCEDGEIVNSGSSFIPSGDGMECELPNIHCVSGVCEDASDCADGTVVTETVFEDAGDGFECTEEERHCLTNDYGGCPQLSPLPPDYCPEGDIVSGSPSYVSAADGMECEMPSVHCVTRDYDACPMFSPLPPDYCEDGEIVQGDSSFIHSTDGMECEIPSVHCVSGACG